MDDRQESDETSAGDGADTGTTPVEEPLSLAGVPGITSADQHLARVAVEKIRRGDHPSRDENAALRRVQLAVDEKKKQAIYRAIPQADWCKLSGRSRQVIRDQARKLGLPMGAATIDLNILLPALHDLFSRISASEAATGWSAASGSPNGIAVDDADSRLKMAKAEIAELDLAQRTGQLVKRSDVQQCYAVIAQSMRKASELIGRHHHGAEARRILDERLDHAQSLLDAMMSESTESAVDVIEKAEAEAEDQDQTEDEKIAAAAASSSVSSSVSSASSASLAASTSASAL